MYFFLSLFEKVLLTFDKLKLTGSVHPYYAYS